MCAITCSASRSCGTAFGWTNDVTSMRGTPASLSRSTTSIFCSVGMKSGSIWKPSRVPTSQIVTRSGNLIVILRLDLADVLVPDGRVRLGVPGQHVDALLRREIDDLHAVLGEPVDAAREVHRFADEHRANPELAHEPAAVPARRQRRHHDLVPVTALASGLPECVCLAVNGRIVVLDAPIVAAPEQLSARVEQRRPDRDAALGEPLLRLVDRDLQHLLEIEI